MSNVKTTKAPKFLIDSVINATESTELAKATYSQNKTEANRLVVCNKEGREQTAKQVTSDAITAKKTLAYAKGIVAKRQLDANNCDNYKSLRRMDNYVKAIEANDPSVMNAANAAVLQAFHVSTKSFKTLSDVAAMCYMKGDSQARNAIRSLVFLGILETEDSDAPQYIQNIAKHSFRLAAANKETKQVKQLGKARHTALLC